MKKRPILFDIKGLEARIKLDSSRLDTVEYHKKFEGAVKQLIKEIVGDKFQLKANVTRENTFSISISALPANGGTKNYQINFDVGLFRMLYDGLYILLSNNNTFSGMGISHLKFDIPTLNVPDWNSLDLAMANNEDVHFSAKRVTLHSFLYDLCLSFIIRHEIRHIANGHVDYLLSNNNVALFFENSSNGLNYLDSQTLEMDVDSCVTAGILDGLLNNELQKEQIPDELKGTREIFICVLFCLQFLFFCMPSVKITHQKNTTKNTHPNSSLRHFFCFTTAIGYLQDNFPEYVDLFVTLNKENFWEFIMGLPDANGLDISKIEKDFEWTHSDEGVAYADKVWDNWNNLKPLLEKYAYLKLAPLN